MSCKVYNSSFNPLFRFLEDFDNHHSRQQSQAPRRYVVRQAVPQWQPKFDIRETEQAFEFFAELPGVPKESVNIKFTDHQTISIQGKTERSYNTPSVPAEEPAQETAVDDDSDKHSTASYQATVEDDFEDLASDATTATVDTPKTEVTEKAETPRPEEKTAAPKAKYWLTERSFGEFSRTFQFPTPVDQDAVLANFKDGVLAIVVPKAKKHASQPITIN